MMRGVAFRLLRMMPQTMFVGLPAWGRQWLKLAQVFMRRSPVVEPLRCGGAGTAVPGWTFAPCGRR